MATMKRTISSVVKDVEEREYLCTVGRVVNRQGCYGKEDSVSFKKIKIELLYDPAIPLLGIYSKETKTLI